MEPGPLPLPSQPQPPKKRFWRPWPFNEHGVWLDATTRVPRNYDNIDTWRRGIINEVDSHGFDWQVFFVSASGFLTDSYALFATNVILPSLAYIYWPNASDNRIELAINCVTLAGSLVSQILFGFLADKYGRRRLYGLELVIVIFGTLGMAQASSGVYGSMNIQGWIIFWRFFMGIGIGAEYPLSAVITAEFANKDQRARMMAAVFMMQPLGQIAAAAVGWGVLVHIVPARGLDTLPAHGADLSDDQKMAIMSTIDTIWRCVIGVGAFPALLAICLRISIPESPRYTMDVDDDVQRAFFDIRRHYDSRETETTVIQAFEKFQAEAPGHASADPIQAQQDAAGHVEIKRKKHFTYEELKQYLWREKNWRYLLVTSFTWFLLDFAFYGLGINNPRQLGAIWDWSLPTPSNSTIPNWPSDQSLGAQFATFSNSTVPDWQNPFDPGTNIYWELFDSAKQYILTISCGSLAGSVATIFLINRIPRKGGLVFSFLILTLLFAILGAFFAHVEFQQPDHWVTVVFYALCQFFFNFGPNTLTFIIPAEIFPTRYRCTFHGISAAMGKAGSLAVQGILSSSKFGTDPQELAKVLGGFAVPMFLGALLAWIYLPELQGDPLPSTKTLRVPKLPSKSLETLARGWEYAVRDPPDGEGQRLGWSMKLEDRWNSVYNALFNGGFSTKRRKVGTGLENQKETITPSVRSNVAAPSAALNGGAQANGERLGLES